MLSVPSGEVHEVCLHIHSWDSYVNEAFVFTRHRDVSESRLQRQRQEDLCSQSGLQNGFQSSLNFRVRCYLKN